MADAGGEANHKMVATAGRANYTLAPSPNAQAEGSNTIYLKIILLELQQPQIMLLWNDSDTFFQKDYIHIKYIKCMYMHCISSFTYVRERVPHSSR